MRSRGARRRPRRRQRADVDAASNRTLADDLDRLHGEPTVCLVPRPQPAGLPTEFGWAAPRSVCIAHAAMHPDHADCVDADWLPVR